MKLMQRTTSERFFAKVFRVPFKCWEWTGKRNKKGYGLFGLVPGQSEVKAHRFIFEMIFGEIGRGLLVRHTCDNPGCVNPMHLRSGTAQENSRDMVTRGRSARGERHGVAKLTDHDVLSIRYDLRHARLIGEDYGVTAPTIRAIQRGETWSHLPWKVRGPFQRPLQQV